MCICVQYGHAYGKNMLYVISGGVLYMHAEYMYVICMQYVVHLHVYYVYGQW